jgi:putative endonuclease
LSKKSNSTGARFEEYVAQQITQAGCRVIARNYRCRWGEIDLVAHDQHAIVFIEVKYRHKPHYGLAAEHVTPAKAAKIVRATEMFLCENPQYQNHPIRLDVITQDNKDFIWLKNAIQIDQ